MNSRRFKPKLRALEAKGTLLETKSAQEPVPKIFIILVNCHVSPWQSFIILVKKIESSALFELILSQKVTGKICHTNGY